MSFAYTQNMHLFTSPEVLKQPLSLNARLSYQGGARFSPVDEEASQNAKDIVFDELNAFSLQADPTLNVHFTVSYKTNKKKSSREVALKILNVTGQSDFKGYLYNLKNNRTDKDLESVVIPNLSYKIEF